MAYSSAYIQERLNKGCLIVLPDDEYNIDKTLVIGSDTTLIMSNKTKLIRNINAPVLGVNPGAKNVTIQGGTIVGLGPKLRETDYGNLTYVFKAENVTFEDVTFEDTLGSHSIDINGSKDVSVLNCRFLGYNANPSALYREAIQIDFAAANTLPEFPTGSPHYDLKCCDGIRIIGCTFDKSDRFPAPLNAIGTHSQPNTKLDKSKNIIISNNIAKGIGGNGSYGIFVHCMNFKNVQIIDNVVENYARFVRIYSNGKEHKKDGSFITDGTNSVCENVLISGNMVTMCEFFKSTGVYAISNNGVPHNNIHVLGNTFLSEDFLTDNHYLTDFNDCKNIVIANNINTMEFPVPLRFSKCTDYYDYSNTYFS